MGPLSLEGSFVRVKRALNGQCLEGANPRLYLDRPSFNKIELTDENCSLA